MQSCCYYGQLGRVRWLFRTFGAGRCLEAEAGGGQSHADARSAFAATFDSGQVDVLRWLWALRQRKDLDVVAIGALHYWTPARARTGPSGGRCSARAAEARYGSSVAVGALPARRGGRWQAETVPATSAISDAVLTDSAELRKHAVVRCLLGRTARCGASAARGWSACGGWRSGWTAGEARRPSWRASWTAV